jgi:hypothetical protein
MPGNEMPINASLTRFKKSTNPLGKFPKLSESVVRNPNISREISSYLFSNKNTYKLFLAS